MMNCSGLLTALAREWLSCFQQLRLGGGGGGGGGL